jgi:predicted permease
MLRRSPGFTAVALVTLALGIGANTTIFSLIDAFFLRPLPVEDPFRLVSVHSDPNPYSGFCYPEYLHFRDRSTVFEGLAAHYSTAPLNVVADGDSKEAQGAVVSGNYFAVLRVRPLRGRFFAPDEDAVPDRNPVAVISFGLWQSRFAGDPAIVGKRLQVNGVPFTVIGVAPQEFRGVLTGSANEMWIPTMMLRVGWRGCDGFQYDCRRLDLIGRLAPGRTIAEARLEIASLAAQLAIANPATNRGRGARLIAAIGPRPGEREYFSDQARLLAAVAGMLLVIACANLAGLLLARGSARGREIAVRLSVGASRIRLVRQLLTESLALAAFGGAFGLALSGWVKYRLLGFYSTNAEGYQQFYDLSLDPRILVYSIALSMFTGLLFGLVPAIQASRQDLTPALKQDAASWTSRRGLLRSGLVAGQVGLSLALLVGAGLLARSAAHVSQGANFDGTTWRCSGCGQDCCVTPRNEHSRFTARLCAAWRRCPAYNR